MGKNQQSYDSCVSNEDFLKEISNDHLNGKLNLLSIDERDYMIKQVVEKFGIIPKFQPAVAKAANYLTGARFWEIYEHAQKAKAPAHYFVKSINKEMYG